MARKPEQGLRYFPLQTVLDDKFKMIEALHGIEGFGVVIKLYQKIYADNYWINVDEMFIIVLSNEINVDINSINEIINNSTKWGLFDRDMFEKHKILTSSGIQKQFFDIVHRRKKVEIVEDYLLISVPSGLNTEIINVSINPINVNKSTQRERERKIKGKGKEKKKEILVTDDKQKFIDNLPGSITSKYPMDFILLKVDALEHHCLNTKNGRAYTHHYKALHVFLKDKQNNTKQQFQNNNQQAGGRKRKYANSYIDKDGYEIEIIDFSKMDGYDPRFPDRTFPKGYPESSKLELLENRRKREGAEKQNSQQQEAR